MAPEILTNSKIGYSYYVDLYSLGILLFEMIAGYHPYI
jgi:serine/threonine protein kinase